jgi:hypothetical protein
MIEGFLADGKISMGEMCDAVEKFDGLGEQQKRVAHARIFAGALEEVMLDGIITDAEAAYLSRVGENLRALGWAP